MSRREALKKAALFGATLASPSAFRSDARSFRWRDASELYPQGVASGDPHPDSVLLWTRVERSETDDGGPISYRIVQRLERWTTDRPATISTSDVDGDVPLLGWRTRPNGH